jgi:hypothetical protein
MHAAAPRRRARGAVWRGAAAVLALACGARGAAAQVLRGFGGFGSGAAADPDALQPGWCVQRARGRWRCCAQAGVTQRRSFAAPSQVQKHGAGAHLRG